MARKTKNGTDQIKKSLPNIRFRIDAEHDAIAAHHDRMSDLIIGSVESVLRRAPTVS